MYTINRDFPGANVQVLSVTEDVAEVEVELRDTVEDWFFWCFKVEGAGGRTVTFRFPSENRVGYYGAAVSHDGMDWKWQHEDAAHSGGGFTYAFAEGEDEVWFAHDMVYRPERFDALAQKLGLEVRTLCESEKGRRVPYVEAGQGEDILLLTARHHACESTGSFVLEGVLEEALRTLADRFRIVCVPFVDYDGVVDGDQGKSRRGHDHNRDYVRGETPWYGTTKRIREIADTGKVKYAFDFHSPWHLGGENDVLFIPMGKKMQRGTEAFAKVWAQKMDADGFMYDPADNMLPDVGWNKSGTPTYSSYMADSGALLTFTVETPYFLVTDRAFSPERARATGRAFVRALSEAQQSQ